MISLEHFLKKSILCILLLVIWVDGFGQINTSIQLDQLLPGSAFTNPSLQIPPNGAGDINFKILDLYDEQSVIPVNQYDDLRLINDNDILKARMVPSIVISPHWDGFFRAIILGSIPDKVFEYDERDIDLRPYFNN